MFEILVLVFLGIIAVSEAANVAMSIKDRYDYKKIWSYRHLPVRDDETEKNDPLPFE